MSSLPHTYSVDVGITIKGTKEEVEKNTREVRSIIHQSALLPHIWFEGLDTLEEVIIREAQQKNIRFAFAESCTGGLCSNRITNFSGASSVFWGSVVSYDNSIKENILGVSPQTIITYGAVSIETAQEMAQGARTKLGVDIVISLTGIAGPGGGSPEKPVGTVCMGIAGPKGLAAFKYEFKGDSEALKLRFSQVGLFHLLDCIRDC